MSSEDVLLKIDTITERAGWRNVDVGNVGSGLGSGSGKVGYFMSV